MSRIIGVDYSLNSPAICIHPGDKPFHFDNCKFGFLTKKKSLDGKFLSGQIEGKLIRDYTTDLVRFLQNAIDVKSFAGDITLDDFIAIEGYAFGAKGSRIFQIGEACGILQLLMIQNSGQILNHGRNISRPTPGEVKKYATGKGNAKKEAMIEAFEKETGIDMVSALYMKKASSPVDDLVDAYWICKMTHEEKSQ